MTVATSEIAQSVGKNISSRSEPGQKIHVGNLPPECLSRMETVDRQMIQNTPPTANEDKSNDFVHHQEF